MALTNNNLSMIKALANNDMRSAKLAALASLTEDRSKKNAVVIHQYQKMLSGGSDSLMNALPRDMQTFLVGEEPGSFRADRYYLRPEEKKAADEVMVMKLVADEMNIMGIPYHNTALFYGASGTGKTELAKYIGHNLNLPFFYISFVSLIDSYMGSTAKNLHRIFEFCSQVPCVLMLDEIDCIAAKRASGGSRGADGELERTTIALIQELDRMPNHVTLIAATNRIDMLDEAVIRRFSTRHEVRDMSRDELYQMAKQFVSAAEAKEYIKKEDLVSLVDNYKYHNPGQLLPELCRMIGRAIYEEKKEVITERIRNEQDERTGVFEVTYTWKKTVCAETEGEAIAAAKTERERGIYGAAARGEYRAREVQTVPGRDGQ